MENFHCLINKKSFAKGFFVRVAPDKASLSSPRRVNYANAYFGFNQPGLLIAVVAISVSCLSKFIPPIRAHKAATSPIFRFILP
jgi:hypothetical protein